MRQVSRCTEPQQLELIWVLHPAGGDDVGAQIQAEVAGMPQLEKDMKLAAFFRVMTDAARGHLSEGDDLGPIHRDPPEIFELRWNYGSKLYRLYFGEPPALPGHLIALRFHVKDVRGLSDGQISEAQNLEISAAQLIYRGGIGTNWGVR